MLNRRSSVGIKRQFHLQKMWWWYLSIKSPWYWCSHTL